MGSCNDAECAQRGGTKSDAHELAARELASPSLCVACVPSAASAGEESVDSTPGVQATAVCAAACVAECVDSTLGVPVKAGSHDTRASVAIIAPTHVRICA